MGYDVDNIVNRLKSKKLREIAGITQRRLSENPQKSYMFEIDILGGGVLPNIGSLLSNITVFAKSATIPQSAVEPIRVNFMGEPIFYAGKDASSHSTTITFWDDEYASMLHYLDQWFQLVHENDTGNITNKTGYQRNIRIRPRDASDTIDTSIVELDGCFPTDISDISLSYDASEVIEITATFQFDKKRVVV